MVHLPVLLSIAPANPFAMQSSLQTGIDFGFRLESHVEPPVVVIQPRDSVHRNRAKRAGEGIGEREEIRRRQLSRRQPQAVELTRHLVGRVEHDGRFRERVEQRLGHLRVDRVALARELQPLNVDADNRYRQRPGKQRDRQSQAAHGRAVEPPRLRGEFELAQVEAVRERVACERFETERLVRPERRGRAARNPRLDTGHVGRANTA